MGNSDIRDIVVIDEIDYSDISGIDVAIDASNWMYKYMTTTVEYTNTRDYKTDDGEEVPELLGCFKGIKKFKENNVNAVFVFDGLASDLKQDELDRRREKKEEAEKQAEEAENEIEQAKYDSRTQKLTEGKVERVKKLVELCGYDTVTAPSAAEAQAALMAQRDSAHVLSNDYDTIIFGSPNTLRNFTSTNRPLENVNFEKTLEHTELTHQELIWAVLLCGTDYNDGVYGVGPATAQKLVTQYDSFGELLTQEEYTIEHWEEIIDLYENLDVDLSVEYSYPTENADLDQLHTFLVDEWDLPEDSLEPTFEFLRSQEKDTTLLDY
jgi:flap endonuclease-1